MKKLMLLVLFLSATLTTRVAAQNYNWAVGVRGGITASGLTVRHNFDPVNAIGGILDFAKGFNVYALYERNVPVFSSGWNFFWGGGVNLGSWGYRDSKFTMGLNLVTGLEYKLANLPLAFSLDYKPNLNFIGKTGFNALDFGLGVKVTF